IDRLTTERAAQPWGLDQIAAVSGAAVFPDGGAGPANTAIGALVATHTGGSGGRATININTAPLPLLEAALREAGAGGLDAILMARAEGKSARIGAIGADRTSGPTGETSSGRGSSAVTLTDSSSSWGIRTDISVGPRRCSWWSVWQRRSGAWRLVQRMEIPE